MNWFRFAPIALSAFLGGGQALATPATKIDLALEKSWHLLGDGLTESSREAQLDINAPKGIRRFSIKFARGHALAATRSNDETLRVKIPLQNLEPGTHRLTVTSPDLPGEQTSTQLHLSYPLYVVVSTDWDNTRTGNTVLGWLEDLHQRFPDLRYTHFFAPYHYTDPTLTQKRKNEIDDFIKRQRDQYGDEIGVHIHGWCHFVVTAGVRCKTRESFDEDDGSGYTTILAAYSVSEMSKILAESVKTFEREGLGRPRSFRAGGWTADLKVLEALEANGFNADSSAVPAHRLESWRGYPLLDWNLDNWAGITETSQPYFPNRYNITSDRAPQFKVLEVPDNGVLVDYVTAQDMIDIYDLNHPKGEPLNESTVYQIGFHPVDSFSRDRWQRMIKALTYVEKHSYKKDLGPAVYVTLSELTKMDKHQ